MGQTSSRKDKKPEAMDTKSAYNWAVSNESEFVERLKLDKEIIDKSPERETLQAKGAFLLSVYTKLLNSAVHLDKLHCRMEFHKRKSEKSPETLKEMEAEFKRGLGEWEKAKAAAEWLARDHGVSVRAVQLGVAELRREETNDKEVGKRKKEMAALDKETKDLKTEAMSVGFHYLDADGSGYLEPTDVPSVPTEIFARLDASGKHRVSWSEVKQAIAAMEGNIKGYRAEMARLRDNNNNLDAKILAEHAERVRELQEKTLKEERSLHAVCDLFRTAFTKNVFDALPHGEGAEAGVPAGLPALSKAVKPSTMAYMVEEIHAPRDILASTPQQPWMMNIGSDIIRRHVPLPTPEEVKRDADEPTAPIAATATPAQEPPLKAHEGLTVDAGQLHKEMTVEPSEQALASSSTTTTTTTRHTQSPKLSTRTVHQREHREQHASASPDNRNDPALSTPTEEGQLSKEVSGLKLEEQQPEYFGKNEPLSKAGNAPAVNPQDDKDVANKGDNESAEGTKEKSGWRQKLSALINPPEKNEQT